MYVIKLTIETPIGEKEKKILMQSVSEADADAECSADGVFCEIRGSSAKLEKLSYLLGIVSGCFSLDKVEKLTVLFEKQAAG